MQSEERETFDFVIVGAGSAGCVLAARLSQDPKTTVLLLEAGPKDRNPAIRIPAAFPKLFDSKLDWGYRTSPQEQLNGRKIYWPRGKVLGGSSSINAMMWVRGAPADYDAWADAAGSNWSYETLLPYFRNLEDSEGFTPNDLTHGVGGPVPVTQQRDPNELTSSWIAAAQERGIGPLASTLLGSETGVGLVGVNQRNGKRVSAATAYLEPARHRRNLTIRANTLVHNILIEDAHATGVAYRSGRTRHEVSARRDVIIAAGAVNSPQLLMCSGIGPGPLLKRLGVAVHADIAGVGENLQDHLTSGVAFGAVREISLARAQSIGSIFSYLISKRGPLTSNVAEGYGFIKSDERLDLPDLELLFVPSLFINEGLDIPRTHGMTLAAVLLQPASRGSVTINSPDASVSPIIDPRYLSDEDGLDASRLRIGIETCINISTAPSLAREITELVQPSGPLDTTTAEQALRQFGQTLYHPVGTCRMGDDAASVVDSELRVRGVTGLRVVDASVIPVIPHGHTHAPTLVLAERAADLITS